MDCLFCKIINGDIPSYKIYEDDYTIAFLDINPDSDGHTLIIPKKHFKDLDDIDIDTLNYINLSSKKVKKILEDKLKCDGITLLQNNGSIQEVKHYHLHLKPFYNDRKSLEIVKHQKYINNPSDIYKKIKDN
ncbi:MAG: HIT domain-containing protein [bacterium]|nr:HIT domain-containing protein [bacterium]